MNKNFNFRAGKLINNILYFSDDEHCGLYKLDIVQQKISFLFFFPEEDVLQKSLHGKAVAYGDCVFFIPGAGGKNLHIYNRMTEDIKSVPLLKERGWSGDAFIEGEYLWMISFYPNQCPVIRVDLHSLEAEEFPHFFGELVDYDSENHEQFIKRIVVADKSVWFAIHHSKEIVQISLVDFRITKYQIEVEDLFGVFFAHNEMWFTSLEKNAVYKWSPDRGIYEKCKVEGLNENIMPYNCIFEIDGEVFALPFKSGCISKYNEDAGSFQILSDYPVGFHFSDKKSARFSVIDYNNDTIICFPFDSKDILLVDIKTNTLSHFTPCMMFDAGRDPYLSILDAKFEQGFIYEDYFTDLREYFQLIDLIRANSPAMVNHVGSTIFGLCADEN